MKNRKKRVEKKKSPVSAYTLGTYKKRFDPALKRVVQAIQSTPIIPNSLVGYETDAGVYKDPGSGINYQIQVRLVCQKKKFISKRVSSLTPVLPIINKWAVGVRMRAFLKYVIEKIFS